MKMLGKSRAIALAASLGLTFAAYAEPAGAQGTPATKPADKPAAAAPAAAPKPGDAKALYSSGEKKFKSDDFAGALADFEASNAAKAAPETTRYIALSHDKLQHYSEAVTAYEKFIAENPSKMKSEVDEAQKRVDAIKAMPAKVHIVTTPPGASIVLDQSQAPEANTTPTDVELKPGKHTILIGAEGYENASKEVDVTYASKQDLNVELVKKAEQPPPPPPVAADKAAGAPAAPPPPPEPRSKIPAFVTGGVAIVAAGIGTAFGISALGKSNDFKDNPTTKRADDGENNALVADMMFGIAITFGVTSAVLFLSSDSPSTAKANVGPKTASAPPKPKSMTIIPAPYVTPNGGGAGALVRF